MKPIKIISSILYFIILIYIVFFTAQRQIFKFTDAHSYLNLVPVINKVREFQKFKSTDLKEIMNYIFNLAGNIILFIPFSLIMFFVFNIRHKSTVIIAALTLSVLIEVLQFVLSSGVTDIDDVLLNVTGAFLGWLLAKNIFIIKKGKSIPLFNFL